jgi:hypothetical protein
MLGSKAAGSTSSVRLSGGLEVVRVKAATTKVGHLRVAPDRLRDAAQ